MKRFEFTDIDNEKENAALLKAITSVECSVVKSERNYQILKCQDFVAVCCYEWDGWVEQIIQFDKFNEYTTCQPVKSTFSRVNGIASILFEDVIIIIVPQII